MGRNTSFHQALLELEQAKDSPSVLLNKAAGIIGVTSAADTAKPEQSTKHLWSAPREEWILRWLMKKARQRNAEGRSYRSDPACWHLLREVVVRIPPQTLITILQDYKLLDILNAAVHDLDASLEEAEPGTNVIPSTTTEAQDAPEKRKKKRKRPSESNDFQTLHAEQDDKADSSATSKGHRLILVLQFLTSLISLPATASSKSAADLKSRIRLVLRSDVETAATIVSSAYRHAASAISSWTNNEDNEITSQLLQLLPSVHTLWECRSHRSASDHETASHEAFMVHMLPESLALLQQLQKLPSNQHDRLRQNLESSIALFCTLPLRNEYHAIFGTATDASEKDFSRSSHLCNELRRRMKSRNRELRKDYLPLLLDVIARAVPRETYQKESQEAPWLEAIFVALTARCGCPPGPDAAWPDIHGNVPLLGDLLEVAIARRITLSLHVVFGYFRTYTGLAGPDGIIDWRLIASLLRLSIDVVLPNSGLKSSQDLLHNLTTRITALWLRVVHMDDATYDNIKNGIIIPMLQGFSIARDLSTFVEFWTDQLQRLQAARETGQAPQRLSAWEDSDVLDVYATLMSSEMAYRSAERVTQLFNNLDKADYGYSSAILLDALLPMIAADLSIADGNTYLGLVRAALRKGPSYTWSLWRLACHLMEQPSCAINADKALLEKLMKAGAKQVEKSMERPPKATTASLDQSLAPTHAFRFIALTVSQSILDNSTRHFESIVSRLVALLGSFTDGKRRSEGVSAAALAYELSLVILAHPASIAKASKEVRSSLFDAVFTVSTASDQELQQRFTPVWSCMTAPDWLETAPSVVHDIVTVIQRQLESDMGISQPIIDSLLSIPAALVPPHQRVGLLDSVQQRLASQRLTDPQIAIATLSLLTRLVEQPKSSTALLVSDPEGIWAIARNMPDMGCAALHTALQTLFKAVFERVLLLSQTKQQEVLRKLASLALDTSAGQLSASVTSALFFTSLLTLQTLTSPKYGALLDCDNTRNRLHDLHVELQSVLSDKMASLYSESKRTSSAKAAIDNLDVILACLQVVNEPKSEKQIRKLIRKIDDSGVIAKHGTSLLPALKRQRIFFQEYDTDSMTDLLESCFSLFAVGKLQSRDARRTFNELRRQLYLLNPAQICELLKRVLREPLTGDSTPNRCLIAGLLFTALPTAEGREGVVFETVSVLFSDLCRYLPCSETPETFCMILENINLLMHTQTRCITQWNVDNMLAAMSIALSAAGMPQINTASPGLLYVRICRALAMLFGQYRQKLSGRMHIVVTLMQRLLACLFIYEARPGAHGVSQAKLMKMTATLPKWITAHDECEIAQDPQYAIQCTRLLTLLCDPTVSAVQRHKSSRALGHISSGNLTDNTKKVKSLAGQHLQYVILEYTLCSLRGRILPSVKAALAPGLYAILSVMSQEGLRGMNASMDGSTRAVFRSLYENYKRFGRWDQG